MGAAAASAELHSVFLQFGIRFPYSVMDTVSEPLMNVADLAERLGVGERFVRRLVDERRIPFLKVGRHFRFQPADIER